MVEQWFAAHIVECFQQYYSALLYVIQAQTSDSYFYSVMIESRKTNQKGKTVFVG